MRKLSMKWLFVWFLVLLLPVLLLSTSCDARRNRDRDNPLMPEDSATRVVFSEIEDVIDVQVQAVQSKDETLYLSTIFSGNETYFNESRYLARRLPYAPLSDFQMTLLHVSAESPTSAIAQIQQSYLMNGTLNEVTFHERFLKDGGRWLDNDIAFEQVVLGELTVFYTLDIPDLERFVDAVSQSIENVKTTFPDPLSGQLEIKLYSNQELLRQKTDLSIAWLFTGWAEEGHAIKAFTGRESDYSYEGLFTHELIHKLTIFESRGNMPLWFAEGLAIHYGTNRVLGSNYVEQGKVNGDAVKMTLDQLRDIPLEKLTVQSEILTYYATAGLYLEYLADSFGDEAVFQLYRGLGAYPKSDMTTDPTWASHADERLEAVIKEVIGQTLDQISEGYLKWLEGS